MIASRIRIVVAVPLALLGFAVAQTPAPPPVPALTLKGHTDPIGAVAVSPDGKFLATASFDKTAKLWDGATGKELRTLAGKNGHANLVLGVAFAPDGSALATVSSDNQLKIWDIANGKPTSLLAHAAGVTQVAASADGKLLAAGGADGTIRIWTALDGKLTQTLSGHAGAVIGLGFAPNGLTLYSAGADKTLRYWTPATGIANVSIGVAVADITGFWVNPANGTAMVATADGALKSYPAALLASPKPFAPGGATVTSMTLSADGNTLLAVTADNKLRSWATATGLLTELGTVPAGVNRMAFGPPTFGTAVGLASGRVLFLGADGKPKGEILACETGLKSLAFAADLTSLFTLGTDGVARRWPVAGLIPPAVPAKALVHTVAIAGAIPSADGKKVITAGADNAIRIWNAGVMEREFKEHKATVTSFAALVDGVVSADASGETILWNPADGKIVAKLLGTKKAPAAFALISAAKSITIGYADGEVRHWPTPAAKDKEILAFTLPKPPLAMGLSVDGKRILSVSADGKVRSTNPANIKDETAFAAATVNPTHAVLSADRTKILELGTVGNVRTLLVRPNLADSKPVWSMPVTEEPEAIAYSNDGLRIAIAVVRKVGRAVRILDAATGVELQTVAEPLAPVTALIWQPDNKTVLTASDKTVSAASIQVDLGRATVPSAGVASIQPALGLAACATADKFVRFHEIAAGPAPKELKAFGPLADVAKVLALSKDGTVLAAATGKTLAVWQTADAKPLTVPAFAADIAQLAFSADKTRLVVGLANGTAIVVTVATGLPEQVVTHVGGIAGLAFHPTLPVLFSAGADKAITATPLVLAKQVSDATLFGGALSGTANGTSAFSSGTGKGVAVSNTGTGAKERSIGDAVGITAIAANKAGTLVAVAHGPEPTITVHNFADGVVIGSWKTGVKVTELAFHPMAPALAGLQADSKVAVWNTLFEAGQPLPPEFGKPMLELPHPAAVKGLSFVGDGSTLLTGCDDKQARMWKFVSDQPSFTLAHPNIVHCAAFDKTGKFVATGCQDGILRIFDVSKIPAPAPKAISAHILPQGQSIYAVAWHPDGKLVASGSLDKSIKIWDAAAGTIVKEIKPGSDTAPAPGAARLPGHTDQVFSLAYTKDGKQLASAGSDRAVKLWNTDTGALVREFTNPNFKPLGDGGPAPAHPGFVQCVKFNADNTKLVSVGTAPKFRGYLAVWNVADGKLLYGSELEFGPLASVDVRPDGSLLLGCGPKQRGNTDSEAVVIPFPVK